MKRVLFFPFLALFFPFCLVSCGGTPTADSTDNSALTEATVLSVDDFLEQASSLVGTEVQLSGDVEHVCSHSGRRCFLTNAEGVSVRVEAGGEITGFPTDILGHCIVVTGVVKEFEIPEERIDQMEADLAVKEAEGDDEGHCDTERNNIEKMRAWMQEHGRDAYIVYYLEGITYSSTDE